MFELHVGVQVVVSVGVSAVLAGVLRLESDLTLCISIFQQNLHQFAH